MYGYFLAIITVHVAQLVQRQHVNLEVTGSNPTLVNFSLFIQNLSKICAQSVCLVVHYMIFLEKESCIPLWCIPLLPLPRLCRNLHVGVIPG